MNTNELVSYGVVYEISVNKTKTFILPMIFNMDSELLECNLEEYVREALKHGKWSNGDHSIDIKMGYGASMDALAEIAMQFLREHPAASRQKSEPFKILGIPFYSTPEKVSFLNNRIGLATGDNTVGRLHQLSIGLGYGIQIPFDIRCVNAICTSMSDTIRIDLNMEDLEMEDLEIKQDGRNSLVFRLTPCVIEQDKV